MFIEINNKTKFVVDKKLFTGIAKKVIKGENKEIDLSIAFVSKEEIKKANKKYRGKNKPTDVLAFEQNSKFLNIGEVVICLDIVQQNAKKFGNTFKEELIKILIHGILHVCGYEHEKTEKGAMEMDAKENKYFLKII